jgi:hypothetical protein
MPDQEYRVHGCGLKPRTIRASSAARAAQLFHHDVHTEMHMGNTTAHEGGTVHVVVPHQNSLELVFTWEGEHVP